MNELHFVLVLEKHPNDYDPIYWTESNDLYDLEAIDKFTSKYSSDELKSYLIEECLLSEEQKDLPLQIIYNNNGYRKLKHGLIYKDDNIEDFTNNIENFILSNQNNSEILNNLFQKIQSERLISQFTKQLIMVAFKNRNLGDVYLKKIIDKIDNCRYLDRRMLYFFVKEIQEKSNEKQKKIILNKKQ